MRRAVWGERSLGRVEFVTNEVAGAYERLGDESYFEATPSPAVNCLA